jgi:hypothetical protein
VSGHLFMSVFGLPEEPAWCLVRGNVRDWLRQRQIPALRTPARRGWCIRSERIGDVIAQAELDGIAVTMRGPLR